MQQRISWPFRVLLLGLLLALVAVPASGEPEQRPVIDRAQSRVSQAVLTRAWIDHPEQAPEALRSRFQAIHDSLARARTARTPPPRRRPAARRSSPTASTVTSRGSPRTRSR